MVKDAADELRRRSGLHLSGELILQSSNRSFQLERILFIPYFPSASVIGRRSPLGLPRKSVIFVNLLKSALH